MRIFCDMEFTGLRQDTKLISIGIVADDGRKFYCEANDYDLTEAGEDNEIWLKENVIPHLLFNDTQENFHTGSIENDIRHLPNVMEYLMKGSKDQIGMALDKWLDNYEEVTFVGDVLAYDWILFCDLLGESAKDLPSHVSYTPIDIASLMYSLMIDPMDTTREKFVDVSDINKGKSWQKQHNALYDALVVKKCFNKLTDMMRKKNRSHDMMDRILQSMEEGDKSNHIIIPEKEMRELNKLISSDYYRKEV